MKLVWESQAKCSALLPPPVRGTSDDQPPVLAGLGHSRHLSTERLGSGEGPRYVWSPRGCRSERPQTTTVLLAPTLSFFNAFVSFS